MTEAPLLSTRQNRLEFAKRPRDNTRSSSKIANNDPHRDSSSKEKPPIKSQRHFRFNMFSLRPSLHKSVQHQLQLGSDGKLRHGTTSRNLHGPYVRQESSKPHISRHYFNPNASSVANQSLGQDTSFSFMSDKECPFDPIPFGRQRHYDDMSNTQAVDNDDRVEIQLSAKTTNSATTKEPSQHHRAPSYIHLP